VEVVNTYRRKSPRRKSHRQNSEFAMGHGLKPTPSAILDAGAPQYEVSIAAISAQTAGAARKVAPKIPNWPQFT
jgi:hypothetical protein